MVPQSTEHVLLVSYMTLASSRRGRQRGEVRKLASHDLAARLRQSSCRRVRASETSDVMASLQQLTNDSRADEAGASSDEYLHDWKRADSRLRREWENVRHSCPFVRNRGAEDENAPDVLALGARRARPRQTVVRPVPHTPEEEGVCTS